MSSWTDSLLPLTWQASGIQVLGSERDLPTVGIVSFGMLLSA